MITKFDIHKYIGTYYKFFPFKGRRGNRDRDLKKEFSINYIKDITYNNGWYTIERKRVIPSGEFYVHKERLSDLIEFLEDKRKIFITDKEEIERIKMEIQTKKFNL